MSSSPTEGGAATGLALLDVTMPQMGVSVSEGTVVAWRVSVGDSVTMDQTVCDISTDKIDTEVPAPRAGVIAEILVDVEETVPVGTVLARLSVEGGGGSDSTDAAPPEVGAQPLVQEESPAVAPSNGATPAVPVPQARHGRGNGARYSPVVQRIAAAHGIDLSTVTGTGRGGRVRKQDVMAVVNGAPGAGAPVEEPPLHIESPYRPEPAPATTPARSAPGTPAGPGAPSGEPRDGNQLSRMRRTIGEHMKRSLEVAATCTTWIEADMSQVETARARLGVTALAFVARACVLTLREYPALNAWMEEGGRYTRHDAAVHLGIAVSLGEDGLIVPVVHDAHTLSVEGLAERIRDLARRARSGGLTPDEVRGGTFTITNPGQYGSIMATPIINQPQVAILDFEAVVKRPVVVSDEAAGDAIAIRPMTILGLSWDHRALDGALSAQFLARVRRHLESGELA